MSFATCSILSQFYFLIDNNPYDEIALWSGRGAGKSRAVAQYIILRTLSENIKVLCIRQIRDSAKDSVFAEIEEAAIDYGLDDHFKFGTREILAKRTGSKIIYRGLHDNIHSIKSISNIKLCWVEEAHELKQEALQLLYPTILRNEGAKIIYTYNPNTATDAIYKRFNDKHQPPNSKVLRVDWRDNPYFDKKLKSRMAFDKKYDPEMAMHIWEGELCPSPNDIAVIPLAWLRKCVDAHLKLKLDLPLPDTYKYVGLDIADGGKDKSALALRHGPLLLDAFEFDGDIMQAVPRADLYAKEHGALRVHFDSIGIGAGAKIDFNRISNREYLAEPHIGSAVPFGKDHKFTDNMTNGQFFRNLKAQAWWHIRLRVENTLRLLDGEDIAPRKCFFISSKIPKLDKVLMELGQASYKHEDGKLMVDKQPDDQPSPNLADSVVMAFIRDARSGLKAR